MQRKSFDGMSCPIARSLEHVGEWWNILIMRDALLGFTRFDQFERRLGIAPNMLTKRLGGLVESGLLERRSYSERPPRAEYLPTERGRDFEPVLWAMLAWGNKHFAPDGASVVLVDSETGVAADPILVDRISGRALASPAFRAAPGPAAPSPAAPSPAAQGPTARRPPARLKSIRQSGHMKADTAAGRGS